MTRSSLLGAALVAGLVLVGGCGTEFVPGDTTEPRPTFVPDEQLDAAPAQVPFAITIPKIDAHSTLIPLGLNPDRTLEVSPVDEPLVAGWYAGEDKVGRGDECIPGSEPPCSAVVAGHVDGLHPDGSKGAPGIFARLDELAVGDEILVESASGAQQRWVVDEVEQVAKAAFPSEKVYERDDRPRLTLITCGGAFGTATPGHYDDNVLVHAVLA